MLKINYPYIEIGNIIPACSSAVWDVLFDTSHWLGWRPTVTAVETSDRYIHKGSTGRVRIIARIWLPFLITDFDSGMFWAWRVAGLRAIGHCICLVSQGQTICVFQLPFYVAPYIVVCRFALYRIAHLAGNSYLE